MNRPIEFILNHSLLAGATAASLIALVVYEYRRRGLSGMTASLAQAVQLINKGATVVDIRDAQRFNAGHIVDALNMTTADLTANAESRLKKKRTILVVCENGLNAARLVSRLRQEGFEKAWALEGGQVAWQKENLPVTATPAKPGAA